MAIPIKVPTIVVKEPDSIIFETVCNYLSQEYIIIDNCIWKKREDECLEHPNHIKDCYSCYHNQYDYEKCVC